MKIIIDHCVLVGNLDMREEVELPTGYTFLLVEKEGGDLRISLNRPIEGESTSVFSLKPRTTVPPSVEVLEEMDKESENCK